MRQEIVKKVCPRFVAQLLHPTGCVVSATAASVAASHRGCVHVIIAAAIHLYSRHLGVRCLLVLDAGSWHGRCKQRRDGDGAAVKKAARATRPVAPTAHLQHKLLSMQNLNPPTYDHEDSQQGHGGRSRCPSHRKIRASLRLELVNDLASCGIS